MTAQRFASRHILNENVSCIDMASFWQFENSNTRNFVQNKTCTSVGKPRAEHIAFSVDFMSAHSIVIITTIHHTRMNLNQNYYDDDWNHHAESEADGPFKLM